MMRKDKVYVLWFGLGGHHCDAVNERGDKYWISGHDTPELWDRSHVNETHKYDGALVIDKRAVLRNSPALAFREPLCDPTLADDTVDRCPQPSMALVAGVHDEFRTYMVLQEAHRVSGKGEPGPLDSISPKAYGAWWRARGARIGTVKDDHIVWENEEVR